MGIEPRPLITSNSKSNTILSSLTWHLLGRLRLYLGFRLLLILTESSKSKNQVLHEQKFNDLLSSTCLSSSERNLLDMESEVMRGLGSIPTGVTFCHCFMQLRRKCHFFIYFVKNLNEFTDKNICQYSERARTCHPATSCVRDQNPTAVPARHVLETGSLN